MSVIHPFPFPEVVSKLLPTKRLVVLLHGIGVDGNNLIGLASYMQDELPDCHFFAPHGIERYDQAAYGRQWFSLQDRTPSVMQQLLEGNIPSIMETIQAKQKALNLGNNNTIIIGFSQGAMLGLYMTFTQKEPFLATISFSGLLLRPLQCINPDTPICLIHGLLDQVIPIEALDNAVAYLEQYHIRYSSHRLSGLDHTIDDRGIWYALHFIKNVR